MADPSMTAAAETAPPQHLKDIFIGRQPIFDRRMRLHAYELLFRGGDTQQADVVDGDRATSLVLVNTFLELGIERITGEHPAFVNLTRNFLVGDEPLPFPREQVVLEVLEDVTVDTDLIAALQKLRADGYRVALDDFVFHEGLEELVAAASVVKLDVMALDRISLHEQVEALRRFPVKLLAEKVETQEDFELCRELGFDYFQGYFFGRPKVMGGKAMAGNRLAVLRLLARMQDPDVAARELDQLISQDVALSYKLLRYINSAFFALPRKVESIQQAVVYVGMRTLKTWVTLISLAGLDDKPHELLKTAMVRARMCQNLAGGGGPGPEAHFTVGLFSALDAMMDAPMDKVLASLPLTEEVSAALLEHQGVLGTRLDWVLAHEQGRWDRLGDDAPGGEVLTEAYLEAVDWAERACRTLGE